MDLSSEFKKIKLFYFINFSFKQGFSFILVLIYLIFEYLRPQSMYPVLNVIPWLPLIFFCGIIAMMIEGRFLKVKNR